MKRFQQFASITLLSAALVVPTIAGETPNGVRTAGETPNGVSLSGETPNGVSLSGETPNGVSLSGETPNGLNSMSDLTATLFENLVKLIVY